MKLLVSYSEITKSYHCPSFGPYTTKVPTPVLEFLVGHPLNQETVELIISNSPRGHAKKYLYSSVTRKLQRPNKTFYTLVGALPHHFASGAFSSYNLVLYIEARPITCVEPNVVAAIDSISGAIDRGEDFTSSNWAIVQAAINKY